MIRISPILGLAAYIASTAPASAVPIAQPPALDTRIERASGGLERCWTVYTPWGPQRRCRSYGSYYGGWRYSGYGGYGGHWLPGTRWLGPGR